MKNGGFKTKALVTEGHPETWAVVIQCVDQRLARVWGGIYEFLIKKDVVADVEDPHSAENILNFLGHIDHFTHLGGARILCNGEMGKEVTLAQLEGSIALHKPKVIILCAHGDCGASKANGEAPKNGDWRTLKIAELQKAKEILAGKNLGLPIHLLYIDHESDTIEEV